MDINNDHGKEYLLKHIVVNASRVDEDIEIHLLEKKVLAKVGDWLVELKDGRKMVMDNETFKKECILLEDHLEDPKEKANEI